MSRAALALSFVAGIVVGAMLVWLLADAPEPSSVVANKRVERSDPGSRARVDSENGGSTPGSQVQKAACADIESMAKALDSERVEVAGLKQKLTDRLDALKASQDANPNTGGRGSYELDMCRLAMLDLRPDPPVSKRLKPNREKDHSFDVEQLVDMGFPRGDAEWIQDTWQEAKLDKLYLADRLARGERPEPGMGFVDIERALREDLGEDDYDAMLYSTNQNNAVSLGNVVESSAAYAAGLRGGRVIYSYNGQRVFKPMELQALINATQPGEVVAVELKTKDGLERIFVDSGVIGVSFVAVRSRPIRP